MKVQSFPRLMSFPFVYGNTHVWDKHPCNRCSFPYRQSKCWPGPVRLQKFII